MKKILILIICFTVPAFAEDVKFWDDAETITTDLFMTAYMEYGKEYRLAAMLRACDMGGLSKAARPAADEIFHRINAEFKKLSFYKETTAREKILVLNGVMKMLTGFEIGFAEAIKKEYERMPDKRKTAYKKALVKEANERLENKP